MPAFSSRLLFISYFTTEGRYPELAECLKRSLERFDLAHDIEARPPFTSWAEGCRYKSSFIFDRLLRHRGPVVWLDVDTEVKQRPVLLEGDEDFAIYNWLRDRDHHLENVAAANGDADRLLCSGGVQKWGYSAPAMELLLRWIASFDVTDWQGGDDPLLDKVYNSFRPPVRPLWLPKTYNRMTNLSAHWAAVPTDQVVVEHHYTGGAHRRNGTESASVDRIAAGAADRLPQAA